MMIRKKIRAQLLRDLVQLPDEISDDSMLEIVIREADASDGLAVMAPWWARHNDEPTPEWAAPGSTALVSEP